jgi:hypothetical protein
MATTGTFGYRSDREGAVKIEGLSAVQRDLRKMGGDLDLNKAEFLETNKKVAEVIIEGSKRFVPVLSGALAESIRQASTKKAAKVRVGTPTQVPYAGAIHFGWPARRIKPQSFIYDTIDGRRAEVAMLYAQRLTEIQNRYFREGSTAVRAFG